MYKLTMYKLTMLHMLYMQLASFNFKISPAGISECADSAIISSVVLGKLCSKKIFYAMLVCSKNHAVMLQAKYQYATCNVVMLTNHYKNLTT